MRLFDRIKARIKMVTRQSRDSDVHGTKQKTKAVASIAETGTHSGNARYCLKTRVRNVKIGSSVFGADTIWPNAMNVSPTPTAKNSPSAPGITDGLCVCAAWIVHLTNGH